MINFLKNILGSIRPVQWIKNLLIFAPLIFSLNLFNLNKLFIIAAIFILFCLLAGSVYIINDVIDNKKDKIHPRKRFRPITSGELKANHALITAMLFLFVSLASSYWINGGAFLIFIAYFTINLLYSFYLKKIVILDAIVISIGFILRLYAGALPINIKINHWMLACVFLLSLFLVFAKRRQELNVLGDSSKDHRSSLSQYSIGFLDQIIGLSAASALISYMLWTISDETISKFRTESLFYTTLFVFFGILRYLYHIDRGTISDNPLDLIFKDWLVMLDILAWLVMIILIIYHQQILNSI